MFSPEGISWEECILIRTKLHISVSVSFFTHILFLEIGIISLDKKNWREIYLSIYLNTYELFIIKNSFVKCTISDAEKHTLIHHTE